MIGDVCLSNQFVGVYSNIGLGPGPLFTKNAPSLGIGIPIINWDSLKTTVKTVI